jgi:hypothetical protein
VQTILVFKFAILAGYGLKTKLDLHFMFKVFKQRKKKNIAPNTKMLNFLCLCYLFVIYSFCALSRIFHSQWNVTTGSGDLQSLNLCHLSSGCDTKSRYLRSNTKIRPTETSLTWDQGYIGILSANHLQKLSQPFTSNWGRLHFFSVSLFLRVMRLIRQHTVHNNLHDI